MEAARSFLYQFLSLAFSYPYYEVVNALADSLGDLDQSLRTLEISYNAGSLRPVLRDACERPLELQGEYNTLFATTLKAPSWETAYEIDKTSRRAMELADIEGFYRAFGVNLSAPIEPDSLVAQLEFLALLLQKKLYAEKHGDGDGGEICAEAYRKFITDHLGRWYAAFVGRLAEATDEEYYRRMGGLLEAVIDRETAGSRGEERKLVPAPDETLQGSTWACET